MQHIQFKTYGSSAVFGNFAPGDTLRCSDDVARHFVEDAKAADYVPGAVQPPAPSAAAPVQPAAGAARLAAKRARRADGA